MRRALLLAAVCMVVGSGGGPAEADAAEAAWCGLYCDAVYIGCRETIGHWDQEACTEWHAGCLEGCKVNG